MGKSTLIHNALTEYPTRLQYLKDYTTRPQRKTDTGIEYTFVNDEEFDRQRSIVEDWQEGSLYGNRYGHDTAAYRKIMNLGGFFIGCCYPSIEDAQSLDKYYDPSRITIVHVELPQDIRAERLVSQRGEEGRMRLEKDADWTMSERYQSRIDFIFDSVGTRDENRTAFRELLGQIFLSTSDEHP